MIQIHTYKSAIDFLHEVISNNNANAPKEVCDLYNRIRKEGKEETLDFFVNYEFPKGTDEDEYREFFLKEWKLIEKECFPTDCAKNL